MPPKRPRFSRWRRLPGVSRIHETKIASPTSELQRLTLYLPGGVLDQAEAQAMRAGAESVQAYCESLLTNAIEEEQSRARIAQTEVRIAPLEALDALANDPDYLAEWSASAASQVPRERETEPVADTDTADGTEPDASPSGRGQGSMSQAREVVLRHATILGDDPQALLATLRRGEPMTPDAARELLQALIDLEREHRDTTQIDRRLAYALHRLAFEGQILLTEAWPGVPVDAGTVDALRIVQEAVDRVLSGEDIRYYAEAPSPSPST
jgi:hypothetical protein